MTRITLLRSRMTGNGHVRFCRRVASVTMWLSQHHLNQRFVVRELQPPRSRQRDGNRTTPVLWSWSTQVAPIAPGNGMGGAA
jgi:hypothetical protein